MRPLTRTQPRMSVASYKTYGIVSPRPTHFRRASCKEVSCSAYIKGWTTTLPNSRPDLIALLKGSGRQYRELNIEEGKTTFVFEPGQSCFKADTHKKRLDRPELYLVRGGDWRGQTSPTRKHDKPEHWVEDFAEHQEQLHRAQR